MGDDFEGIFFIIILYSVHISDFTVYVWFISAENKSIVLALMYNKDESDAKLEAHMPFGRVYTDPERPSGCE